SLPLGSHTITLTVSSSGGGSDDDEVLINIVDTTAPTITVNGANPMTVECHTSFIDPGATANDGCAGSFAATASGGVNVNVPGSYTITYSAMDPSANSATPKTRTVIVVDTSGPTITLNGQTPTLWPPDHKYHTFNVTDFVSSASDSCDTGLSISDVVISQVTSDEPENGGGDGNTLNDIVIGDGCKSVQLRAERKGGGNGRVYTITFSVRDSSGNVGTATARVLVPSSQGGNAPVDDGPHYTVTGSCP
ncbi:MAG TPA: immunoglobulin-like domain-containing protein, partial [Pyrinomonadaceae bacterium]|nr:immunoglobulin-like domain-containing protein [Pyrinomonadaceae bacterium]